MSRFNGRKQVTVSAAAVSGLTKGSTQITGVFGYQGGTVVLDSTEELIKRVWAVDPYYKQEASTIDRHFGANIPGVDAHTTPTC